MKAINKSRRDAKSARDREKEAFLKAHIEAAPGALVDFDGIRDAMKAQFKEEFTVGDVHSLCIASGIEVQP